MRNNKGRTTEGKAWNDSARKDAGWTNRTPCFLQSESNLLPLSFSFFCKLLLGRSRIPRMRLFSHFSYFCPSQSESVYSWGFSPLRPIHVSFLLLSPLPLTVSIFSPESVHRGFILPEAKVMNSVKDKIFNSKDVQPQFFWLSASNKGSERGSVTPFAWMSSLSSFQWGSERTEHNWRKYTVTTFCLCSVRKSRTLPPLPFL